MTGAATPSGLSGLAGSIALPLPTAHDSILEVVGSGSGPVMPIRQGRK